MKRTGFIYDDIFLRHQAPAGHPETEKRLVSILEALDKSRLKNKLLLYAPVYPDPADIEKVHTREYISMLSSMDRGFLDSDTYFSEDSYEAALYAAGAVLQAVEKCRAHEIDNAFCAVRPPGHHAEKDMAMGFCLLNNIAVGTRYAQKSGYRKVFIIDFDVHHGNGTQNIFYEDDTVYYFSTHQFPFYPGTGSADQTGRGAGSGFTANFPLPGSSGDREYLNIYEKKLPELVRKFDPDLILVSAGYDLSASDPLGGMKLSDRGLRKMVRAVLDCKDKIPCIFVLEGGYNLNTLGRLVILTLEELLEV